MNNQFTCKAIIVMTSGPVEVETIAGSKPKSSSYSQVTNVLDYIDTVAPNDLDFCICHPDTGALLEHNFKRTDDGVSSQAITELERLRAKFPQNTYSMFVGTRW